MMPIIMKSVYVSLQQQPSLVLFLCFLQIACINLQEGYKILSRPGEHMTLADSTDPLGNLLCSELTPTS